MVTTFWSLESVGREISGSDVMLLMRGFGKCLMKREGAVDDAYVLAF
jgi:hypothetical protein